MNTFDLTILKKIHSEMYKKAIIDIAEFALNWHDFWQSDCVNIAKPEDRINIKETCKTLSILYDKGEKAILNALNKEFKALLASMERLKLQEIERNNRNVSTKS